MSAPFKFAVKTGASNENAAHRVPTVPVTVIVMLCAVPEPADCMHASEVADVHEDVPQVMPPTAMVGVRSAPPKFDPDKVTETVADVAPFV